MRKLVVKQGTLPLQSGVNPRFGKADRSETSGLPNASAPMQAVPGKHVFLNRTLPANYSTIVGVKISDFPQNDFGCNASWYTDDYQKSIPTCPFGTLEVH